jgi:hypothetical protein
MAWVAAMHLLLLLLSSAAAAARASVMTTLGGAAGMLPPRLSLAEEAGSPGDYEEDDDDGGGAQAIAGSPIVAGAMNSRLKALTSSFARTIGDKLDYCIKDTETEWNAAFDFSKDTTFLTNCMKETKGACVQACSACSGWWLSSSIYESFVLCTILFFF